MFNTSSMQTQKYLYKNSGRVAVFLGVISSIGLLIFARMASNNQRGLIINRILKFSPAGATWLYWVCALVFAFGLLWLLWAFLRGEYKDQYIFLTDNAITVPVLYGNRDPAVVRLVEIREMSILTQERTNYRILRIEHAHGCLDILEGVLNSAPLFNRLKKSIFERVDAARQSTATGES